MTDLNKIRLFRMTHIVNIPHILENGITHIVSPNKNPDYKSIGDGSLINYRNKFSIKNGRKLGEYIPFYFGPRMPMLFVIKNGFNGVTATPQSDIIYCVTNIATVIEYRLDWCFTDGHAVERFTDFYFENDLDNIEGIVDFKAVKTKNWIDENDLDLKRRMEAEFLVVGDIPPAAIRGFVVYNEDAKAAMALLTQKPVVVRQDYYF